MPGLDRVAREIASMRKMFLILLLWPVYSAWGDNSVVGDWRNGPYTYHIPVSSGKFSLSLTDSSGQKKSFQAQWETPGEKFRWVDAQSSRHTAEFDHKYKQPRFRDVGENYPDSPAYWYRATP